MDDELSEAGLSYLRISDYSGGSSQSETRKVTRIWSDMVRFSRAMLALGGGVGFAWTGHDWAGLTLDWSDGVAESWSAEKALETFRMFEDPLESFNSERFNRWNLGEEDGASKAAKSDAVLITVFIEY
jgi:hypothetical protein